MSRLRQDFIIQAINFKSTNTDARIQLSRRIILSVLTMLPGSSYPGECVTLITMMQGSSYPGD